MDSCVHIWHLQIKPGERQLEMVEFSCGGYSSKVTHVDFNREGRLLASAGGSQTTIWDFAGDGPADSVPLVALGHSKTVTCQVGYNTEVEACYKSIRS